MMVKDCPKPRSGRAIRRDSLARHWREGRPEWELAKRHGELAYGSPSATMLQVCHYPLRVKEGAGNVKSTKRRSHWAGETRVCVCERPGTTRPERSPGGGSRRAAGARRTVRRAIRNPEI